MVDSLNAIIDATTAAGANQIGSITFLVSDTKQQEVRDGLVTAAIADASSKADKLTSNMGVKVVGVQIASVSERGTIPLLYSPSAPGAAVSTPI